MTITLAAVYAPVGIQGGLTGSLFREFAFTLAGAVIVSGVVALTLSPMMGSKLLRAGDSERGFAGWIHRALRARCASPTRGRCRARSQYRPVVFALWAIVAALIVPFYAFSQRELAPAEDQGVVFSIVQSAPNATLDQTRLFTPAIHDVYRSLPETASIFQITSRDRRLRRHGAGAVERAEPRPPQELMLESAGPLAKIPGIRAIPLTPPPLPGGGDFPVDLVIASAAEPRQLDALARQLVEKASASGLFLFVDADLKFDQPQTEVVFDRDKLRSQGVDLATGGPGPRRRCSAATTSTGSASTGAATR